MAEGPVPGLVSIYRQATARIRRNDRSAFDLATNVRSREAHALNGSTAARALAELTNMGQQALAEALSNENGHLKAIPRYLAIGDTERAAVARAALRETRRTIRALLETRAEPVNEGDTFNAGH